MRRDRDRDYVPWRIYLRGLLASQRRCTRCGDGRIARSHTPFRLLGRLLGLVAMRCRGCTMKFALRGALAGARTPTDDA
jgi:hypothetical protein